MDINCDLGEGMPNDRKLMGYVDSCNIACGGHAGDRESMIRTLRLARQYGVRAGAHPSFEDKKNFGRKVLKVPLEELRSQLIRQISDLRELASAEGVRLHHIKAHGALYSEAAYSETIAEVLIGAVEYFEEDLCIFVPCGSIIEHLVKKNGVNHWVEVFADRNYTNGLKLVPRREPNAVITNPVKVRQRVVRMLREHSVETIDGPVSAVYFDTICVHGDHPYALEILKELHDIKMKID